VDARRANERIASVAVYPGTLTESECARVRSQASLWPELHVGLEPAPSEPIRVASTRTVVLNAETEWVFARISQAFHAANRIYGFAIDDAVSDVLFVAYEVNGFLGWHTDLGNGDECTRKLSMSILLDGPGSYSGGGLQMVSMEHPLEERRAGSAIVFPSHLAHRVLPVTQGRRQVLVAWMHGPTFR
jgi:PKHD-type hydroxylase